MAIDPTIADYIRKHRRRYTREAVRQQLIDAGHDPGDIDATWAALDAPDPDQTAGEGFWGRFWLILAGINVGVFLLVGLLTGMLGGLAQGTSLLLVILGVALALTALMAYAIVAATRPTQMGRTTALTIGIAIPLVVALLVGGTCYALVGAIGGPPIPAVTGDIELRIDAPLDFEGAGIAYCQVQGDSGGFNVYTDRLGVIDGRGVSVSIDSLPTHFEGEGGPAPAPEGPGGELSLNLLVSLFPMGDRPGSEGDVPREWHTGPGTTLDSDIAADALSGTITFDQLEPSAFEGPAPGAGATTGGPISGTVTWTCE